MKQFFFAEKQPVNRGLGYISFQRKVSRACAEISLLGKQLGVSPDGWEKATTPYGDADAFLSVADITSPETLDKVRANKRAMKAKVRAKG